MTSSDRALDIQGLVVTYGIIPALRGTNIRVEKGETVALIGPNGAGKTTLLRAVSGLATIEAGAIRTDGRDITRLLPWEIAGLGVAHVPQGRRCFGGLTVEENLTVGGYRLTLPRARLQMEAVYDAFPVLLSKRRQMAAELSGGQQQMLAIGRALMSTPGLLLLDEPSLGLSPVMVQEVIKTLASLVGRFGTAVLLAEQNTRLALRMSRRAYVLRGGRIVLEGESAAISGELRQALFGTLSRPDDPPRHHA
jgi:branched-chain amino acid transport system ATP-binding protein